MLLQVCGIDTSVRLSGYDVGDQSTVVPSDRGCIGNLRVRPEGSIYLAEFDSVAVYLYLPVSTPDEIDHSAFSTVTQVTGTVIALRIGSIAWAEGKALGGPGRVIHIARDYLAPENTDLSRLLPAPAGAWLACAAITRIMRSISGVTMPAATGMPERSPEPSLPFELTAYRAML